MGDPIFEHPRLAAIYDALDGERTDLLAYVELASELEATSVLDIGSGTGTFALLLAATGLHVVGLEPAEASVSVARDKPGSETVTWIQGDVTALPRLQVDLVTMTGNVAQVFTSGESWQAVLSAARGALRPGGKLVFEVRDPLKEAWLDWTREKSYRKHELPEAGVVESWVDVIDLSGELVTFCWTYVFTEDGVAITSESTLRFRSRDEILTSLEEAGFICDDVRDAPDRPGLELVFIAHRPSGF